MVPALRYRVMAMFVCVLIFYFPWIDAEAPFAYQLAAFKSVLADLTEIKHPSDLDSIPDGFVYLNSEISSEPRIFSDPLFSGFQTPSILLSRRSQICKPTKANSTITVDPPVTSDWVDESLLAYPDTHPPLPVWYPSVNFSHNVTIMGLTVSQRLLDHGIFQMEPAYTHDITAPSNLTKFPKRWFYASNTEDLRYRVRLAQDDAHYMATIIRTALFLVTAIVFQTGFFASSSWSSKSSPEEAAQYIMDHCTKGDLRLQHLYFRPGIVSIIGYKIGRNLTIRGAGGRLIGLICRGQLSPKEMVDFHMDKLRVLRNWQRGKLIAGMIIGSLIIKPGPLPMAGIYTATAILLGAVRAAIWNEGIMLLKFWGSAAVTCLWVLIWLWWRSTWG